MGDESVMERARGQRLRLAGISLGKGACGSRGGSRRLRPGSVERGHVGYPVSFARFALAALLFLLLHPAGAAAEKAPYWLMPGGGYAWLPNEFLVKPSRPQLGLLIGARMSGSFAAEAHGTYFKSPGTQPLQPSLGVIHVEGNLTLFLLGARGFTPYLTGGAGSAYLHYEGSGSSLHQFAYGGGGGFRIALGENVWLRLQGRNLRYKVPIPPTNVQEYRDQPEIYAGVTFGVGGPERDRDHDGVTDDDDRCPGTPAGAR